MYPTPFSLLATQWSHPCDVTVRILPVQYPVNETREGCPDSFPPNLNKRRGPNTVRAPSQVPHESAYICQLCSFYPHPSLIVFSVSQAGRLAVEDVALSITMHCSRVSSPPPQPRSPTSRNPLPWVFIAVNPTHLSRRVICRPMKSLNSDYPLRHPLVRCHRQPPYDFKQVPSAYKRGWLSVSSSPESA